MTLTNQQIDNMLTKMCQVQEISDHDEWVIMELASEHYAQKKELKVLRRKFKKIEEVITND